MKRLACLTLALIATPALAQDCSNASTQAEMDMCSGGALQIADRELNELYAQIRGRLKNDTSKTGLLITAQRAWRSFRDAECSFSTAGTEDGSIRATAIADCKERLMQPRIEQFRAYLNCAEGDTGCPVPMD